MPITIADTASRIRYVATASQTVFAIPFEFFANSDIKLYQNGTLKTLTTHYSLTGAGVTGGGNATLVSGATLNDDILIIRDLAVSRATDFSESGPFSMATLNEELDKQITMIRQIETLFERRVLRVATTDTPETLSDLPVKASRAGYVMSFDSSGNPVCTLLTASVSATADAVTSAAAAAASAAAASTSASAASTSSASAAASLATLLASGHVLFSGSGAPSAGLGSNGDFYLDSSGFRIYQKAAGSWGSGTSLVGPAGAGSGDMLKANNLSDVISASTAFGNIKQNATAVATGVVELATPAEATTGTDTTRAVTPEGLKAHVDAAISALRNGVSAAFDTLAEIATELALKLTAADIANTKIATIQFIIDGGGSAITTGVKGDLVIPFACTINSVTVLGDQSGSIVVDIWKDTYANFPPTVADTIVASAKPTLSAAAKSQDTTLTGWTTSIAAGETLRYNVDSITTCTRVTVALKVTKS